MNTCTRRIVALRAANPCFAVCTLCIIYISHTCAHVHADTCTRVYLYVSERDAVDNPHRRQNQAREITSRPRFPTQLALPDRERKSVFRVHEVAGSEGDFWSRLKSNRIGARCDVTNVQSICCFGRDTNYVRSSFTEPRAPPQPPSIGTYRLYLADIGSGERRQPRRWMYRCFSLRFHVSRARSDLLPFDAVRSRVIGFALFIAIFLTISWFELNCRLQIPGYQGSLVQSKR